MIVAFYFPLIILYSFFHTHIDHKKHLIKETTHNLLLLSDSVFIPLFF